MLKLALDARLPLVAVTTRDTLNFNEVVTELTSKKVAEFTPNGPWIKNTVFKLVLDPAKKTDLPYDNFYTAMQKVESTLIVVNPPRKTDTMYDAGEMPVPRTLLIKFLKEVVSSAKKAEELARCLGGCTIKEATELCMLTMSRDKSLTAQGIMTTRKMGFQGTKGLTQVDVNQGFYEPPNFLVQWVATEKKYFLNGSDPRLIPRGLLFDGRAGTGKTAGSKWLGLQLGVPLYRLDIGGAKGKYVGESEGNLLTSLTRVDAESPAILLIDEVEKIFTTSHNDASGTTSTMLSQLLWWLAEHKSRILTIMTTNNAKALPPELYREGRINSVMVFEGLHAGEAHEFVKDVVKTFPDFKADVNGAIKSVLKDVFGPKPASDERVSQAKLTEATYQFIKQNGA